METQRYHNVQLHYWHQAIWWNILLLLTSFNGQDVCREPPACGKWVPIAWSSVSLIHVSLVYRSLLHQAWHRAAWNCIFMNRAEAPYTAIKRECSDISHWQHEYSAALFQAPNPAHTHTHKLHPAIYCHGTGANKHISPSHWIKKNLACGSNPTYRLHLIHNPIHQHDIPMCYVRIQTTRHPGSFEFVSNARGTFLLHTVCPVGLIAH